MWKPCCCPGLRPCTFTTTCTLSPTCSKVASPKVLLPLVGCNCAVARKGSGGTDAQAASRKTAAVAATNSLMALLPSANLRPSLRAAQMLRCIRCGSLDAELVRGIRSTGCLARPNHWRLEGIYGTVPAEANFNPGRRGLRARPGDWRDSERLGAGRAAQGGAALRRRLLAAAASRRHGAGLFRRAVAAGHPGQRGTDLLRWRALHHSGSLRGDAPGQPGDG